MSFKTVRAALLILLAALTTLPLQAQSSEQIFTLEDAIQTALANSPEIKRAILSVDDADQLVKIAYAEVFPDVSSSVSYTRNIEIPVNFIPAQIFDPSAPAGTLIPVQFGTDNNWQGGFTVSQNIFKGEALVGISSATVFKTVQTETLRATSQQVITQVRIAYYSVLVAQEQLRLQKAQIRRLEENLRENRSRAEAGMVDNYDVLSLEVQLSNQRPQLIEAEYQVEEAYRVLKRAMGLPLDFPLQVKGDLNEYDILGQKAVNEANAHLKKVDQMNPFEYTRTGIDSMELAKSRGDLRILNSSLELKDRELKAIKSRFLPTLTASYNLQWSSSEPGTPNFFENNVRFQTLGFSLSLPIFQGMQRIANVDRAIIQRKDLEEQKRQALLDAQHEVASAAEALNRLLETANARKQALEQAREGYERAIKRLENGLGSQIEVTDAELQVRQAEVNYARMVYDYLSAKAQYDLATGQVPFADIKP